MDSGKSGVRFSSEREALVLGLGNLSRRDDGLGWFTVNEVRGRLGLARLGEYDDGLDALGHEVDCAFVPQLAPELAEVAAQYRRLVIVDVRVTGDDGIEASKITGELAAVRLLSHELSAGDFVSLIEGLYHCHPCAYLVSVKGHDYDFGVGLSSEVAAVLPEVVEEVLALVGRRPSGKSGVRFSSE